MRSFALLKSDLSPGGVTGGRPRSSQDSPPKILDAWDDTPRQVEPDAPSDCQVGLDARTNEVSQEDQVVLQDQAKPFHTKSSPDGQVAVQDSQHGFHSTKVVLQDSNSGQMAIWKERTQEIRPQWRAGMGGIKRRTFRRGILSGVSAEQVKSKIAHLKACNGCFRCGEQGHQAAQCRNSRVCFN